MNQLIAVPLAAAVPVASPSIANAAPDEALIDLGVQFDAALEAVKSAHAAVNEISEQFHALVEEGATWPDHQLKWTLEEAGRYFAKRCEVGKETHIGRKYEAACDAIDDANGPIDRLSKMIRNTPALGIAGLGVKAKAAALNSSFLWDSPVSELDWNDQAARSLIEDTLALAGLPPAQDYLGNDLVDVPPSVDPILFAIEVHRDALAKHNECIDLHSRFEEDLVRDVIEADDPRWIACEQALDAACDAMDQAAYQLLEVHPTTAKGAGELLRYFVETDGSFGTIFPDRAALGDGNPFGRSYENRLMEHVGEALAKIGV